MAMSFNESTGSAQKNSLNSYKFENGRNVLRIVGDILPRYVYWVKGENNKNIPMECLAFDRDTETFNNLEKDWVREYYPDLNCSWSYVTQCIEDGQIKIVNLKKKLWQQVIRASKSDTLGDPTNFETGWDIIVTREKTGPLVFNIEYSLEHFDCKRRALNEEELEVLTELKSMDEIMPRPTPAGQKEFLDRIRAKEAGSEEQDNETLEKEFKLS